MNFNPKIDEKRKGNVVYKKNYKQMRNHICSNQLVVNMVMNVPFSISEGHFLNSCYMQFKFKKIIFGIHYGPFPKPCHVNTTPP